MAADKNLIQGAAALAQADTAMGSAFTKGAAAGAAPVMKKFMEIQERETKLEDEIVANAEAINMKIMTDPNAAGEYHDNIKAIATTTRSEILAIAKDKSLSRSERNRLITEKVDGFNSTTSKYLVGQKIEGDFKDNLELGNFSNENTALKEEAARLSSYFKGGDYRAPGVLEGEKGEGDTEGGEGEKKQFEIERTETGFVFKDFDGKGKDKAISFEELKNYLPKKVDSKALNKMEVDVERLAKKKYDTEEDFDGAIKIEMNGYNIDERKNLLSNKLKYGDISGLSEEEVNTKFEKLFMANVKGMVQPEDDTLAFGKGNRADAIAGIKRSLSAINKIKDSDITFSSEDIKDDRDRYKVGNQLITNIREHLPDGFSVQEAHYESKDGIRWVHPVIIKDNQKFEIKIYNNRGEPLDKMPTGADVRRAMLNFYQGDIERYNITRPTPPQ